MSELIQALESIFDRMESKLKDIEAKNTNKVDDVQKLKDAIANALEKVSEGRNKCLEELKPLAEKVEAGEMSKEEFIEKADECIKEVLDEAKAYLGKDQVGVKTAKATFSRCVNTYKKKVWKKILES